MGNITLIFRKRLPQFNSIEGVFANIYTHLEKSLSLQKLEVPFDGAHPKSILSNLKFVKNSKGDINHITGHINYVALVLGSKSILTIHDLGSAFYGNFFHRLFIKLFWFWLPALMVRKITVISSFSKDQVMGLIPFAEKKIKVIYNPVSSLLEYTPKSFNRSNPIILHLGTKTNKNLERTIKALNGLKCTLLVIGELTEQQVQLLEQNKINFRNKQFLPFSEIKAAYEECDMLSFVSLYEGFGMPVIEAQAVGRPVLSSNVASIPEVAGNGALLVDPIDVTAIRVGIMQIIEDDQFRTKLINRGRENVKRFQIEKIATQYKELYKEVAHA